MVQKVSAITSVLSLSASSASSDIVPLSSPRSQPTPFLTFNTHQAPGQNLLSIPQQVDSLSSSNYAKVAASGEVSDLTRSPSSHVARVAEVSKGSGPGDEGLRRSSRSYTDSKIITAYTATEQMNPI
ncbi:uncharacterized protein IL334_000702 [Kwoniella shivajii]|uniref:Uncharacterized protein n=1 Tax=Kwoniella shivajii TaxID=564305 RepID=A0ABZ1CU38_9TREE|nr:hypothetical protein IL334_000702 [Kwoniella shivajii]